MDRRSTAWIARWSLTTPTLGRRTVSDMIEGPNNLDLLRLIAAIAVLWEHVPFVTEVSDHPDPLAFITGDAMTTGNAAVFVFFALSGMLITSSLDRANRLWAFALARVARLWPGLLGCIAVLGYIVVPLATHTPFRDSVHLHAVRDCLHVDALFPLHGAGGMCEGVQNAFPWSNLPDIFAITLWTLPLEVHCYILVLAIGVAMGGRISETTARRKAFLLAIAAAATAFVIASMTGALSETRFALDVATPPGYEMPPIPFFIAGMAVYALRRRIRLDGRIAAAIVAPMILTTVPGWYSAGALVYGALCFAGTRWLHPLRPRMDISYGVYVYGFAGQQIAARILDGSRSSAAQFGTAVAIASLFAAASWIAVERPCIHLARWATRRMPARKTPMELAPLQAKAVQAG